YAPTLVEAANKFVSGEDPEIRQCESVCQKGALTRRRSLLLIESGEASIFADEVAIKAAESLNERNNELVDCTHRGGCVNPLSIAIIEHCGARVNEWCVLASRESAT